MTEYVVPLPWQRPPLTMNSRASIPEYRRLSKIILASTAYVAKNKVPRDIYPLTIELVWYPGNNRVADSDNIATTLKHCIDGLVRTGVLPNDSPKYVVRTSQRVVPRDLDPHDRSVPAMFLVVNTCAYDDMPHYPPSLTVGD